jgi:hypothetical protein
MFGQQMGLSAMRETAIGSFLIRHVDPDQLRPIIDVDCASPQHLGHDKETRYHALREEVR